MKKNRVISIVLGDPIIDSRVKKTADSLNKFGYEVLIIGLKKNNLEQAKNTIVFDLRSIKLNAFKYIYFLINVLKIVKKNDILHCNDLNECTIGVLVKYFKKDIKIVYDSHEFQLEKSFKISRFKKIILKKIESICIKNSSATITVSNSISKSYKKLYGVEPKVIFNMPSRLPSTKSSVVNLRDFFKIDEESLIFIHHGIFPYHSRGIELMLEAFMSLSDKYCLLFIGGGEMSQQIIEHSNKTNNIFYHEFLEYEKLLDFINQSDYGLILNRPGKLNHEFCMPNKLFDYAACGKKIISNNLTEISSFINENEAGYIINDYSAEALKKCIISLKGKEEIQFVKDFTWENQEHILKSIYEEI